MTSLPPMGWEDRFWAKVWKTSSCWLWTAAQDRDGYGWFKKDRKQVYAHRIAWLIEYGEDPTLFVLHRCDTPSCVRPSHLFLGTNTDNIRDASRKGRLATGDRNGSKKFSLKGELSPASRISDVEAYEICVRYLEEGITQQQLADEYGISNQQVSNIVRGIRKTA